MEHNLLAVFSGSLVGFVLGLIGGGGSVLAVPLLVYVVGVQSPHVAIGTSAVAVALSAVASLVDHARHDHVKWRCAIVFAAAGIVGAALGSELGKQVDGQKLLLFFGILMLVIAGMMFMKKHSGSNETVELTVESAPKLLPYLLGYGVLVGAVSGFFGIGGGFLIVPGLMAATNMPMIFAIGSSLFCVAAFGFTTAGNYALSGFVDWQLVGLFISGGVIGGLIGRQASSALAKEKRLLSQSFAAIVAVVGVYVVARGIPAITG
ncbi:MULTISPECIES: sulfite exporter TauE/SafE family protein [unclassified Hyphomicrobium]|uniref:sulfite exporter TauE/SafE family protein n=1 Tax=unclassified Hyphomicrobium TaxID=2619925 RepID=UPI000213F7EA|nr:MULTISPECIES: sulfite exporter TauE/SafE family protein [unclassified Hyphomicrobium]CCB63326.1 putative exporter, TauE/SafE family [Hyphomicrobium sp. MC1]